MCHHRRRDSPLTPGIKDNQFWRQQPEEDIFDLHADDRRVATFVRRNVQMQGGVDAQRQGDDAGRQDRPCPSSVVRIRLPLRGAVVAAAEDPETSHSIGRNGVGVDEENVRQQ